MAVRTSSPIAIDPAFDLSPVAGALSRASSPFGELTGSWLSSDLGGSWLEDMATPVESLGSFQVNTGSAATGGQSDPHTIGLSNGNILVVWTEASDGAIAPDPGNDIVGKIYDAEGNLVRDSFQINTGTFLDDEDDFDIAATDDGGFVMVFVDDDIELVNQTTVVWQRFDANGDFDNSAVIATENVAADFLANPQVAFDQVSGFSIVTFTDSVGGDSDIRGRTVNTLGFAGAEFDAAQNSADVDTDGDVAVLTNGNFVSVYEEVDAGVTGIEAYITSSAGAFVANIAIDVDGVDAQVASLANGNFVVTWTSADQPTDAIEYAIYNSTGGLVLGATFATSTVDEDENESDVVALPDGDFVITWDNDTDGTLEARRFNADGTADGSLFVVTNVAVTSPNIGVTGDGRILFSWDDQTNSEIYASIWDPRDSVIDVADYNQNLRNFVNTTTVTGRTTGTTINGNGFSGATLLGQAGADLINGGLNGQTISGGAGNDTIFGDDSTPSSGIGDSIDGGSGNDSIVGALGDDTIAGGSNNDTISGGVGNDLLDGGLDGDTVDGGLGDDTIFASQFLITGVGDNITGGDGDDSLIGGGGDDILSDGDGVDTVLGGDGDDLVIGGFGLDVSDGGSGVDTMDVSGFAGGYTWNMATGVTNFAAETAVNFENAITGDGNDSITGTSAANSVVTNGGADTVVGAGGADTLDGGAGSDLLTGGNGADSLVGGAGGDTLAGGAGKDKLKGSGGADCFDFASVNAADADKISDFVSGTDEIALDGAVFGLAPGALPGNRFVIGTAAGDGNDRLIYNDTNGKLFFDADGNGVGAQVLIATLTGAPTLAAADFIVI